MRDGIDKVKRLLIAGNTLSEAVRSALGTRSLTRVGLERSVNSSTLAAALRGTRLASANEVAAMVAELGGTVEEWRELFSDAMRHRASAAVGQ